MVHFEEIEKHGNLYTTALPSSRTGLFYNTFAYPTKISPETIAVYIAAHTKPGDVVLDVFGGSGSTGLAAMMCEHPTDKMKALAESLNLRPDWGARNAVIYEIGKYGAFASGVMADPPDKQEFSNSVKHMVAEAQSELRDIYDTIGANGKTGVVRHIIYSDIMICPKCQREFTYFSGMVRYKPLSIDGDGLCPHCGYREKASAFSYATDTVYDSILFKQITRRKRIPVRVYGQTGTNKWVREANEVDIRLFETSETADYPCHSNVCEIHWGELYRAGYHMGISHLHHFYTKRNYTVMLHLWNKANNYAPPICDAIRLLLLSYNASHATLMTRVVVKKNSKDFVLTGAQSGVLYISSLPVEKNIFTGIIRKMRYFENSFDYLNNCCGRIKVCNTSSQRLEQPDKSIDYIFTDPPFGDFIPYAEVNQINELWLGEPTNRNDEIIISPSQDKGVYDYQSMMTEVFCEMQRVLKDTSHATVVFHSSKATVWNALCAAYSAAGFAVEATTSLEKNQASFKQVVSDGSVQGDPLILLSKGSKAKSESKSLTVLDEVIAEEINCLSQNERRIYSNYIGACLKRGIMVDYDAKTAYEYIERQAGTLT